MKLTEEQLRSILSKRTDTANRHCINVPVRIVGVDYLKKETYVEPACEVKKQDVPNTNVADIVNSLEDFAYKKAHKPRRNESYPETQEDTSKKPICWLDMESTGCTETNEGVYYDPYTYEKLTKEEAEARSKKYHIDIKPYKDDYYTRMEFDNPSLREATEHYQKMSASEKEELKDLLESSKKISEAIGDRRKGNVSFDEWIRNRNFPLDGRDEKLINDWNAYKERANKWIEEHKKFPAAIARAILLDEYPEKIKDTRDEFQKITDRMHETYLKKNADYGSSFDDLFDEFGMTSALLRMKDKYNRLKSITEKGQIQVKDESVEDTLLDLANYAILTVLRLRRDKNNK